MYNNIPSQLWMLLDKPTRTYLATVFEIPMTGVREIIDDRVISDGYSNADLKAITLEKMVAYIGSEETFPRAWEKSCEKANSEINPVIIPMADEPKEEIIVVPMADEPKEEIIETNIKINENTNKKSK